MCIYTLSCSGLIFTKLSEIFKVLSSCKIFPEFALATCHDMLRLIIKSISGPDSFLVITVYCSPGEINTAGGDKGEWDVNTGPGDKGEGDVNTGKIKRRGGGMLKGESGRNKNERYEILC